MGFSADWLTLREAADQAARGAGLLQRAARSVGTAPVILGLGCGTGATARAMAPYLPEGTVWRLLDNDPELLKHAKANTGAEAEIFQQSLEDLTALPLDSVTLVTASALLDLCSVAWVKALAAHLAVPFYAALSYNGIMGWKPDDPRDAEVTAAFNAHQRTDKGFGPALGPDAGPETTAVFEQAGFDVHAAQSPWQLGPDMAPLQRFLTDGIANAAGEMGLSDAGDWGAKRARDASLTHCVIGHVDLFAIPGKTL